MPITNKEVHSVISSLRFAHPVYKEILNSLEGGGSESEELYNELKSIASNTLELRTYLANKIREECDIIWNT